MKVCSKKSKSLKEIWKGKIRKLKDSELTVKAISGITGISKSVIYRDLKNKSFEGATKKGTGEKSDWAFTHDDVCTYIDKFEDNIMSIQGDETPPTKKIPFPGWEWK